jgi:hypothetical protein
MTNRQTSPILNDREARRTVIPTPRRDGALFAGWGVKL